MTTHNNLTLFDMFFNNDSISKVAKNASISSPSLNIYETETDYLVKMPLVGVDITSIKTSIKDNVLYISHSATEKGVNEEMDTNSSAEKLIYKEYSPVQNFEREVKLFDKVDINEVKAKSENGLLVITLKRKSPTESIEIKIEN